MLYVDRWAGEQGGLKSGWEGVIMFVGVCGKVDGREIAGWAGSKVGVNDIAGVSGEAGGKGSGKDVMSVTGEVGRLGGFKSGREVDSGCMAGVLCKCLCVWWRGSGVNGGFVPWGRQMLTHWRRER